MSDIPNEFATRDLAQAKRAAFTAARILDAAEVAFARRGLAGTRVREIARAADVNGATLYNYYPSKHALYEAVLERGIPPLSAILSEFAAASNESESARHVVRAVMQHLSERPHLSKLIYLEAISEGDFLPKLAHRWFRPILEQIMGEFRVRATPAHFDEELYAYMAALFVHLSFGHFALAPLLAKTIDEDPISLAGVERQTRLIETLLEQLFPRLLESAKEDQEESELQRE